MLAPNQTCAKPKPLIWTPGMAKRMMSAPYTSDLDATEAEVMQTSVSPEMLQEACDLSWFALAKFDNEGAMARFLKKYFDQNHGASWQVIVGKKFGSYLSVDSKNFIHLHIGRTAFLLYKTYAECEYKKVSGCLEDRCV